MKYLIGVLVALGVLVGGYMLFDTMRSDGNVSDADDASAVDLNTVFEPAGGTETPLPVAIIRYSASGYQPAMVTIRQGETVRWINDDTEETWPAAAVHPTHSMYPEKSESDCLGSSFDACRGLAQGESWDFTFTAKGTWRFHDHLNPSKTGSIIVE